MPAQRNRTERLSLYGYLHVAPGRLLCSDAGVTLKLATTADVENALLPPNYPQLHTRRSSEFT